MNLTSSVVPKSTQLNSDDLISGPRTIKITAVMPGASKEQPIAISFEGDEGRPYLPSKSMRRVLILIWGAEGDVYPGRRITLYRDPEVKFGGDVVGGIKISHASHIDKPMEAMLTATRGKRKAHNVEILEPEVAAPVMPADWANWTNEERGVNRAAAGTEALKAWWISLTAEEKSPLKAKLDGEWKTTAAALK